MAPIDYKDLLKQALDEYGIMIFNRQELDLEIAKKKQFIRATMNMLPDEDRDRFNAVFETLTGESLGLTDAIRRVLQSEPKKSFTATDVRDKLRQSNFDFSSYKTNPLASIHAVLKRLKSEEVESTDVDGVAAWRWIGAPLPSAYDTVRRFVESFENTRGYWESVTPGDDIPRVKALRDILTHVNTTKK